MASWLEQQTGLTDRQWIEYVQNIIAANTVPSTDPNHGDTDILFWIVELTEKIDELVPAMPVVDGNMWTARVLSAVLAAWYHNVQQAKIMDTRRPIALRQEASARLALWMGAMERVVNKEHPEIMDIFPGQQWEDPFDPEATDGTFI